MSYLLLALGTNLGDRANHIREACRWIEERIGYITAYSGNFETRPVGFHSDHLFLNAAVAVITRLSPEEVLTRTKDIEREMGRTTKSVDGIYHDRLIDIDLLLYDNLQLHTEQLTLPHPRMAERRFVLEPVCQIAPQVIHPDKGMTFAQLQYIMNQGNIVQLTAADATSATCAALNHLLPQLSRSAQALDLERLHLLLTTPSTRIYALRDEEAHLAGMATLCVDQLPTGSKAWIEDVVVDESCRGRGYARQLICHLIAEAQRLQVKSINLTSRPERVAANRLYQSEGFEQRETNVYRWKGTTAD